MQAFWEIILKSILWMSKNYIFAVKWRKTPAFCYIFSFYLIIFTINQTHKKRVQKTRSNGWNQFVHFFLYRLENNNTLQLCHFYYTKIFWCPDDVMHSVKISWFFCHSDFTWNQFRDSRKAKSAISTYLEELNFNFCTCWRLIFAKSTKFRAPKIAKGSFRTSKFSKIDFT